MISYNAKIADGIDEIIVRIGTNGCRKMGDEDYRNGLSDDFQSDIKKVQNNEK